MALFQVFVGFEEQPKYSVEADYYKKTLTGDYKFFKRLPNKSWFFHKDLEVGIFEFVLGHVSVKQVMLP